MDNLFNNRFVQALGVAALVYLTFQFLGWGTESILNILESFSRWYKFWGIKWAEEAAIAFSLLFLLISAVTSSRNY
jgi:hypothetical protein